MKKLRAYMVYSRDGGSTNGAFLAFAHTAQEAKVLAFPELSSCCITDEYIDVAVSWFKDKDYLFNQVPEWSKQKQSKNEPHIVVDPDSCKVCELWGQPLNNDGICPDCE